MVCQLIQRAASYVPKDNSHEILRGKPTDVGDSGFEDKALSGIAENQERRLKALSAEITSKSASAFSSWFRELPKVQPSECLSQGHIATLVDDESGDRFTTLLAKCSPPHTIEGIVVITPEAPAYGGMFGKRAGDIAKWRCNDGQCVYRIESLSWAKSSPKPHP